MDIMFTSINSPVQKYKQGVLQDGLQTLIFDLDNMQGPSPTIEKYIEFQRGLSQNLRSFSPVWTLERNNS
jgi:hypothetical protein